MYSSHGYWKSPGSFLMCWTPTMGGISLTLLGIFLLIFNLREASFQLRDHFEAVSYQWPKKLQLQQWVPAVGQSELELVKHDEELAAADQNSTVLSTRNSENLQYITSNSSTTLTHKNYESPAPSQSPSVVEFLESNSSQIFLSSTVYHGPISSAKRRRLYRVCVIVTIGDSHDHGVSGHGFSSKKEGPRSNDLRTSSAAQKLFPYLEVYRLFEAAKISAAEEEDSRVDLDDQRKSKSRIITASAPADRREYLVATDSPAIVCKMTRDSLGKSASCANWSDVLESGEINTIQCKKLVVGTSQRHDFGTPDKLQFPHVIIPSRLQNMKSIIQEPFWGSLELVDLDRLDNARDPPKLPESEWRPTIVTAFSTNHLEVGLLLLRSLGKAAKEQQKYTNLSAVIWTMESFPPAAHKALACVILEFRSHFGIAAEVRQFDFDAWPQWMRIQQRKGYMGGTGEYAWKAVMIHTVLRERGFVLWADAGRRFRSAVSLTNTLDYIKLKGFASGFSSGQLQDWTHVKQLEFLGAPTSGSFLKRPNCDASGIGFTLKRYRELARPWYECSITRQCIAPDGSSRKNHRQDQAALTVLAALSGDLCQGLDSSIRKNMDSQLTSSFIVGVEKTACYKDPLNFKWH